MLEFKPIQVKSVPRLRKYYSKCDYRLCEYSVGVKLMWRQHFDPQFAEEAGCLIVRNRSHGRTTFDYPVPLEPGASVEGALDAIDSYCLEQGIAPAFVQVPEDALLLIEDTSRETTAQFMKMNRYVDVLIPRGGAGLIRAVVENSTIPVIETGTGNCHIYVDETADLSMAVDIILNAKTQRVGVCNACESIVVHENVREKLLPVLEERLKEKHVEMRADEKAREYMPEAEEATEEDWGKEYLDYIVSIKTVSSIDEAIAHINHYNTKHSEAIITNNYTHAQKFLDEIDAAVVYVNASTRFTDGFEFGYGAEIGISTQKLHARGPMGLLALTSIKNIVYGTGQIRK